VGTLDDVLRARAAHSGYDDWNYVDGTLADIEEALARVKPTIITRVSSMPSWAPHAIAIGLLLVTGSIGGGWWLHHNAQLKAEAEALAKARLMNQPVKDLPSPLLHMPSTNKMMSACAKVVDQLPLSLHGWSVNGLSCSPASANIVWKRQPSATVALRPEGALDSSGDTVIRSIPFNLGSIGIDNSISLEDEKVLLLAALQPMQVKVAITMPKPVAVLPGEEANKTRPKPSALFSFVLPISPFDMNWDSIPGLRINTVRTGTNGWTVEGVMYGK
jgi:hypothetical protein